MVLSFVHFTVDFYGGLTIPLPEPTLTQHFGVSLAIVMLLVGGTAIIINATQPISGWILPKKGIPVIFLMGPIAAALIACIGLTNSLPAVVAMLITASIGIGIIHPEGALAADNLAGRRKGFGMSIFMAGGYFGFSLGNLVSGLWVEYNDQGLTRFWILALPTLVTVGLVIISGVHRMERYAEEETSSRSGVLPFGLVMGLAVCVTVNMCILIRFITIFLGRSFPGQDMYPQSWGGAAACAMGVSATLGALLWGYLSDRFGKGRVIFVMQFLCIPFLYMLLNVKYISSAPIWAAGIGLTSGAVFPLIVVLARQARGLHERLRIGLSIGGAWGLGEVAAILGAKYVTHFPKYMVAPVTNVLSICWICLAAAAILAAVVARAERKLQPSS